MRSGPFRVVGVVSFPLIGGTAGLSHGALYKIDALLAVACPPGAGQAACTRTVRTWLARALATNSCRFWKSLAVVLISVAFGGGLLIPSFIFLFLVASRSYPEQFCVARLDRFALRQHLRGVGLQQLDFG